MSATLQDVQALVVKLNVYIERMLNNEYSAQIKRGIKYDWAQGLAPEIVHARLMDVSRHNYTLIAKDRKKYVAIDAIGLEGRGGSGKLLVDKTTGLVHDIKAYGVIHPRNYGHISTINVKRLVQSMWPYSAAYVTEAAPMKKFSEKLNEMAALPIATIEKQFVKVLDKFGFKLANEQRGIPNRFSPKHLLDDLLFEKFTGQRRHTVLVTIYHDPNVRNPKHWLFKYTQTNGIYAPYGTGDTYGQLDRTLQQMQDQGRFIEQVGEATVKLGDVIRDKSTTGPETQKVIVRISKTHVDLQDKRSKDAGWSPAQMGFDSVSIDTFRKRVQKGLYLVEAINVPSGSQVQCHCKNCPTHWSITAIGLVNTKCPKCKARNFSVTTMDGTVLRENIVWGIKEDVSKRTTLDSFSSGKTGEKGSKHVELVHKTAGTEAAGAGTSETKESWGVLVSGRGVPDSGKWFKSESEARTWFKELKGRFITEDTFKKVEVNQPTPADKKQAAKDKMAQRLGWPHGWDKGFTYPISIGANGTEVPFTKNGDWFIRVYDAKEKKHSLYNYSKDMFIDESVKNIREDKNAKIAAVLKGIDADDPTTAEKNIKRVLTSNPSGAVKLISDILKGIDNEDLTKAEKNIKRILNEDVSDKKHTCANPELCKSGQGPCLACRLNAAKSKNEELDKMDKLQVECEECGCGMDADADVQHECVSGRSVLNAVHANENIVWGAKSESVKEAEDSPVKKALAHVFRTCEECEANFRAHDLVDGKFPPHKFQNKPCPGSGTVAESTSDPRLNQPDYAYDNGPFKKGDKVADKVSKDNKEMATVTKVYKDGKDWMISITPKIDGQSEWLASDFVKVK